MSHNAAQSWSITLTPHRSLTRSGFLTVMAAVVLVNLLAGIMFFAMGAWPVVGFMGLDVLIVWWAFRRNFADSVRVEQISAEDDALTLHTINPSGETTRVAFNRRWVRVELEYDQDRELVGRLFLRSHGKAHEIASFLGAEERQALATALRRAI